MVTEMETTQVNLRAIILAAKTKRGLHRTYKVGPFQPESHVEETGVVLVFQHGQQKDEHGIHFNGLGGILGMSNAAAFL